jgi:peptide/nickel transport system substrate-binding protein
MYYNMNTGEEYPWLAESYELDDDFMGLTLYLRKGVTWSDGEAFTCDDVKFTIEAHMNTETAARRGEFSKWFESVNCIDDFTVRIDYTDINPRIHQRLVIGWENHFVIVPEHIFAGKDIATFTNLDLGKGWPIGTGPYRLALVSPQQVIYDRRDTWWGAETGFMDMPEPLRIVGTNAASDEAYAQLYMTDKLDYGGFALLLGSFEAAKEKNPTVRSWFTSGPPYGAPDGCMYQLQLNDNRFDANVRLALNYALDRQEIVDLAYQGATFTKAYPISAYVTGGWGNIIQPIVDKYDRDNPSQDKVDEYMTAAGYAKNGDGFWEKDGEVLEFTITVPVPWAAMGPVIAEQFTRAGIKAEENLDTAGQWPNMITSGDYDGVAYVHCGSNFDPYDSLSYFHSICYAAQGENVPDGCGGMKGHRFEGDPEMDAAIEMMEKTAPDPNNPDYVKWVETALDVYLREMPTLIIAEELHVITMNDSYWTGWPTADDPYIAPYPCWSDFTLALYRITPTR